MTDDKRQEENGNGRRKQDNPSWLREYASYALVALLAGSGGAGVRDIVHDPRPHPYTSIDADRDFGQRDARLEAVEKDCEVIIKEHRQLSNAVHVIEAFMKRYHPDYEPFLGQFYHGNARISSD